MVKKIYVSKISQNTTDQKLSEHFSQAGTVVSASIVQGINPKMHTGHGYVVMASEKETEQAISKLDRSILDGNTLRVIMAHPVDQEKKQNYYRRRY